MRTFIRSLAVLAALAGGTWGATTAAAENLVVVELFTSQGCSSCPPADALVGELAERKGVLALSFHVDYWNYTGWKDPLSSREATKRQKGYRRMLNRRYLYTPQILIDGQTEAKNAKRGDVLAKVEAAQKRHKLSISVKHNTEDGVAEVRIPAGHHWGPPADVWVALYDRSRVTEVEAGENAGLTLTNTNVVRVFQRIGGWRGGEVTLTLPLVALGSKGRDACAIIVQRRGFGPILGATTIPLPGGSS